MKKKNKKNHIRMRLSKILLCILVILLCAAPRGWAVFGIDYNDGGVHYVTVDEINFARGEEGLEENGVLDWLHVGTDTTVNLYADISQYVYVYHGSVLNIYSGSVGSVGYVGYIAISPDEPPKAQVTVYGTGFEDKLGPVDYGQWTPDGGADTLMGQYEDGSTINLLIWSDIPINLQSPPSGGPEEIQIDIKPGSDLNNINLKSRGVVRVAVFTITGGLDASTIDPGTVTFAGAGPPIRWKICDVDEDGDDDMLFHFKTKDLELDENSTEATLIGKTFEDFGGKDIELTDDVRIVQSKKE